MEGLQKIALEFAQMGNTQVAIITILLWCGAFSPVIISLEKRANESGDSKDFAIFCAICVFGSGFFIAMLMVDAAHHYLTQVQ